MPHPCSGAAGFQHVVLERHDVSLAHIHEELVSGIVHRPAEENVEVGVIDLDCLAGSAQRFQVAKKFFLKPHVLWVNLCQLLRRSSHTPSRLSSHQVPLLSRTALAGHTAEAE